MINQPVRPQQCATCPFSDNPKAWTQLAPYLAERSLQESRVCHNTGPGCVGKQDSKEPLICRGSRNYQLKVLFEVGFLDQPTDEAWNRKVAELQNSVIGKARQTNHKNTQ